MLRVSMKYITDDEDLGLRTYDLIVRFKKENNKFKVMNTVSEGPFVNLTNSSDPSKITIAFKTTSPVRSYIRLKNGKKTIEAKSGTRHEVVVANLKPDTLYHYKIGYNDFLSREYSFRTAPEKGKGRVVFA